MRLGTCHCERYQSGYGSYHCTISPPSATCPLPLHCAASHGIHNTSRTRMPRPTPHITNGAVPRKNDVVARVVASDTGAGLHDPPLVVPRSHTGSGSKGQAWGNSQPFGIGHLAQATPPLGFGHPGKPRRTTLRVNCGISCTHSAHTMVRRTTLRVTIYRMSYALDAHMFVLRRTSRRVSCKTSYTHDSHMVVHRTTLRVRCKTSYCMNGGTHMMIRRFGEPFSE